MRFDQLSVHQQRLIESGLIELHHLLVDAHVSCHTRKRILQGAGRSIFEQISSGNELTDRERERVWDAIREALDGLLKSRFAGQGERPVQTREYSWTWPMG